MLNLRWCDIGDDAINLPDGETGPRARPLGEAERTLINALPGERSSDGFVFTCYAQQQNMLRLRWRTVCTAPGLGKSRLHDLRHTAASHAVMSAENLLFVGRLLVGHRRHRAQAMHGLCRGISRPFLDRFEAIWSKLLGLNQKSAL